MHFQKEHSSMTTEKQEFRASGLFWWNREKIPDGHFAPESAVAGEIEITCDGNTKLELNGLLTSGHPMDTVIRQDKNETLPAIQGILKGTTEYVLLPSPERNGGQFSTNGISYEKLTSADCLKSKKPFPSEKSTDRFTSIQIDLKDLDNWVGINSIRLKTSKNRNSIKAEYKQPKNKKFKISEGSLSISHNLITHWYRETVRATEFTEISSIQVNSRKFQPLDWAQHTFSSCEDLITILCGQKIELDWPQLTFGQSKQICTYYYHRQRVDAKKIERHDVLIPLPKVYENFGDIFESWRKNREKFGPGFYLYLGTIKAKSTYLENRFVNFIWGLESLHRNHETSATPKPALKEKIDRILNSLTKKSDRRWLESRLKNQLEPSLKERLTEIFKELPFDFDTVHLDTFCKECADRRNDISHYGGKRPDHTYEDFSREIYQKAQALEFLYHAAILRIIGIEDNEIEWQFLKGYRSLVIRKAFEAVDLIKTPSKGTLKPK